MADVYVYSGAAGAGTGADWANAFTTLAAAQAGRVSGDTIWVADDHAESYAAPTTITLASLAALRVICVLRSGGSVPPVAADLRDTAVIETTGANALAFTGAGSGALQVIYGLDLKSGSGATNTAITIHSSGGRLVLINCKIRKRGTIANSSAMVFGGTSAGSNKFIELVNTSLEFGSTSDQALVRIARLLWRDTATPFLGATLPSFLFGDSNSAAGSIEIERVDLTGFGTRTLFVTFNSTAMHPIAVRDCKHDAGLVHVQANPNSSTAVVDFIRCGSGATPYAQKRLSRYGTLDHETTIVRTGGASEGGQAIAWKVVTTANASRDAPFVCPLMRRVNSVTGSNRTVTVYGVWGGGAVPNNDEIWMEVAYLGTSGSPLGVVKSSGPATLLTAGAAVASDASTWGGSTTKFKLEVILTSPQPQIAGILEVAVKVGKASDTFYIDPKPMIT